MESKNWYGVLLLSLFRLLNKIKSLLQFYSKVITFASVTLLLLYTFSVPLFLLRSVDYRNAKYSTSVAYEY